MLAIKSSQILGGETHAMWWVEYILNAIVVETVKRGEEGAGEAEDRRRMTPTCRDFRWRFSRRQEAECWMLDARFWMLDTRTKKHEGLVVSE